jgi:DNA-binding NarL/FixJ family response regulator
MTESFQVVIVDDHPVVLEGLRNMLARFHWITLRGSFSSAIEAMPFLRQHPVDLVLTDINLPEINGIEFCRRITGELPHIRVVGMSTFHDPAYARELLEAGGKGFITKNASHSEIEQLLHIVSQGAVMVSPLLQNNEPLRFVSGQAPILTRREKEVLQLIAQGLTNKEIADRLFVSTSTVDSHRKNLLSKFEVLNTAALIRQAMLQGLL